MNDARITSESMERQFSLNKGLKPKMQSWQRRLRRRSLSAGPLAGLSPGAVHPSLCAGVLLFRSNPCRAGDVSLLLRHGVTIQFMCLVVWAPAWGQSNSDGQNRHWTPPKAGPHRSCRRTRPRSFRDSRCASLPWRASHRSSRRRSSR